MWYDDSEEVDPRANPLVRLSSYPRPSDEEALFQEQSRIGLLDLRPGWSFARLLNLPPPKPRMQIAQPKFQNLWGRELDDYSVYSHMFRQSKWVQHPRSSCPIKSRDTIWMNLRRWLRRARKAIYNRSVVGYLTTRGNGSMSSMYNRTLR